MIQSLRHSKYPEIIVLELHRIIDDIFEDHGHVLQLLVRNSDNLTDFDNILNCLIEENDVNLRLQLFSKDLGNSLDFCHPFVFNQSKFESDVFDYGFKIYNELKLHGLYKEGILQYSFEKWIQDLLFMRYTPRKMRKCYGPIFISV